MKRDKILETIKSIVLSNHNMEKKLKKICEVLYNEVKHYNWVGFYFLKDGELILGPFVGEPTEHTKIKIGEGICGQAAALKKTFIVQDVSKETNYLSCSPKVKSEIVIPIFQNGQIMGELDIDSHYKDVFTSEDEKFLKEVVSLLYK